MLKDDDSSDSSTMGSIRRTGALRLLCGRGPNVVNINRKFGLGNLHKVVRRLLLPTSGSASSAGTGAGIKFSELIQTGSESGSGSVASCKGHIKSERMFWYRQWIQNRRNESNGRRTITSLSGVQRDSEVLYVGTFSSNEENGKRGRSVVYLRLMKLVTLIQIS
ncbi:hypothetical protein EVAR_101471_1 [Eumeta japonica]|uniref:Uncharacterized protein n=1 Tax=Eumeta variegata TaxID=151549 RepID=A0A4C1T9U4_EUMVA|nr:hypothetical protein EVAR_101471_1 [Eumeta japonica]